MISELLIVAGRLEKRDDLLFVVLSGEGRSFCAGADLEWFASPGDHATALAEYRQMAALLRRFLYLPQITIVAAHQNVVGGANGLFAVCDFAVAEETTTFAFSEVRLGLIPATILPFIARRVSGRNLRKLMFSAERFAAREAQIIGLADFVCAPNESMKMAGTLIGSLREVSPGALKACKQLILKIESGEAGVDSGDYTASVLAGLVQSAEAKEGLQAFLEKRKPVWTGQK
jgi:methylglutaconyl-CoA hydratase